MDVSAVTAPVADVASGRSMVLSSVMVLLRLMVARASRLAVAAWACVSADGDAKRPKVSAQIESRWVVLSRTRPASLVTPRAPIVRSDMADSANVVTVERIRSIPGIA
jgi:hypothetical protein